MKLGDSSLFGKKMASGSGLFVNKGTLNNIELYLGEDSENDMDDSDEYYSDDGFTLDSFEALENEIIPPVFNVVYPNSHFSDDDEGIDFQTAITNDVEEFGTLWKDGDVDLLPHPPFIATPGITVEIQTKLEDDYCDEQSNPCQHGIINDFKLMMMMMMMMYSISIYGAIFEVNMARQGKCCFSSSV